MMVQYLIDADADVVIPGVAAPSHSFGDIVAPVALALDQEKRVTEQINGLAAAAREAGDYTSEQFMQWFIKEQVEEVATMSDLLRVVERSKDDLMEIENFMAREHPGEEGEDPTAPHPPGRELLSGAARGRRAGLGGAARASLRARDRRRVAARGPFRFYIRQDYLFLIDYGRLLSLAAARAPRLEWMRRFASLA